MMKLIKKKIAQPYLMGKSKVIKPAELLDKDRAKLTHMKTAVESFVLNTPVAYLWNIQ